MTRKRKISISVDDELMERIVRLAGATRRSISATIEQQIRDGIEQEELAVKVFSDPSLARPLIQAFGNPDVLKGIAAHLGAEMDPVQMKLVFDRIFEATAASAPLAGKKKSQKKKGKR